MKKVNETQLKKRMRKMYIEAKQRRPKVKTTEFIHPLSFIQKRYSEMKKFEKKVAELQSKHVIHDYIIDTLFQIICKK